MNNHSTLKLIPILILLFGVSISCKKKADANTNVITVKQEVSSHSSIVTSIKSNKVIDINKPCIDTLKLDSLGAQWKKISDKKWQIWYTLKNSKHSHIKSQTNYFSKNCGDTNLDSIVFQLNNQKQTIKPEYYPNSEQEIINGFFGYKDVNFDGVEDLYVYNPTSGTSNTIHSYYIFNKTLKRFKLQRQLSGLANVKFYPKTKTITSMWYNGQLGGLRSEALYTYKGDSLLPLVKVRQDYFVKDSLGNWVLCKGCTYNNLEAKKASLKRKVTLCDKGKTKIVFDTINGKSLLEYYKHSTFNQTKEITFTEIYPNNQNCDLSEAVQIDNTSYKVALGTFKVNSQKEWNALKQKLNLKRVSCENLIDFNKHSVIATSAGYGSSSDWNPFYKITESSKAIILHYQDYYAHPLWPITDDYNFNLKIVTIPKTHKQILSATDKATDDFFVKTSDSTRIFKYPMKLSYVIGADGELAKLKNNSKQYEFYNNKHQHINCGLEKAPYFITNKNEIVTKYRFPIEDVECPEIKDAYPIDKLIASLSFELPQSNLLITPILFDVFTNERNFYKNVRFYSNEKELYQVFEIHTPNGGYAELANVFTKLQEPKKTKK